MKYDFNNIEKKWISFWEKNKTFFCDVYDFSKPKYYVLDMFPYPSGDGLHVGHPRGYTASDVIARMKKMQGFNVLHPIGWDSFGLPAEQFAIKNNISPAIFTKKNIDNFRKQIKSLGFAYDWSKEISTSDPSYYKWTQWIFIELYKNNLAYVSNELVNFCPKLNTVLANEEVIDGRSERGNYPVIRKFMKQWSLKITKYADRLINDLALVNWPKSTIDMQTNWIGKSVGVNVIFQIKNSDYSFEIFTTRVDTIFGCTYCVLAPEHFLVNKITNNNQKQVVDDYIKQVSCKSDLERTDLNKDKTGVFTGSYAINPINKSEIPIYIADYVLINHGTGAVMGVPAHDDRDYAFAKKYNIKILQVIEGDLKNGAIIKDGKHINSDFANGLNIAEAKKEIIEKLQNIKKGYESVHFKLRDWIFSRQRYWGEPIPIIFSEDNNIIPVDKNELPLLLPDTKDFHPGLDGSSPLSKIDTWVNVKTKEGVCGKRETNIMPQWAGSSWYYIRYLDPKNEHDICDKKLADHWLPVDLYIGGSEHAVLHLLYARFWHKFLYDLKKVNCKEPFEKLFHQGMVLGENNEKMSKSRGNVINPDEIIKIYGADALRLYEMFMGPLNAVSQWKNADLKGVKRFLDRVWRVFTDDDMKKKWRTNNNHELDYIYNFTVKKITEDFENLHFNTAISQMMIFINCIYGAQEIYREYMINFLKMMSCICPFICEELYQYLGYNESIYFARWPDFDETKIVCKVVKIGIFINSKLKIKIDAQKDLSDSDLKQLALNNDFIKNQLVDKKIKKIIIVKDKLINFIL